ncbi:MAG: hypothetical protein P9X26_05290, partial [Candidatus Stygibacter frigidus]|nr:hypothetical protein [Candidatus Stygibacter frigidus]
RVSRFRRRVYQPLKARNDAKEEKKMNYIVNRIGICFYFLSYIFSRSLACFAVQKKNLSTAKGAK